MYIRRVIGRSVHTAHKGIPTINNFNTREHHVMGSRLSTCRQSDPWVLSGHRWDQTHLQTLCHFDLIFTPVTFCDCILLGCDTIALTDSQVENKTKLLYRRQKWLKVGDSGQRWGGPLPIQYSLLPVPPAEITPIFKLCISNTTTQL